MSKSFGIRWLVVVAAAAMLLVLAAACTETVEVAGETIVVEKEVIRTVEVPGETVVVEKEVVKTVEVVKSVPVEVIKEVEVPGQKYVTDPSTGKALTAPQYGGTFTFPASGTGEHMDTFYHHAPGSKISGVIEKLGISNWALDRNIFHFRTTYKPALVLEPHIAESWSIVDGKIFTFKIREDIYWQDKAPMNGRQLTAVDLEWNYHRMTGMGSGFTEVGEYAASQPIGLLPYESITAPDKFTLVIALNGIDPDALQTITTTNVMFLYPPEVVKEHGDAKDWRTLVGSGPYEMADLVEATSITYVKNPNYWKDDEKFPGNRLPYIDELRLVVMPDKAARLSALRTGKLDALAMFAGGSQLKGAGAMDQVESLRKTNPELLYEPMSYRSTSSWIVNTQLPPYDDVRVRHALQMALNLEEINTFYHKGYADTVPQGWLGVGFVGYVTPFEEWSEELKGYYTYDPEGAEALLDAAGHPRDADGIRFKAIFEMGAGDTSYAEMASSYWQKIGIDVEIQAGQSPTIFTDLREGKGKGIYPWIAGYEWNVVGEINHNMTGEYYNLAQIAEPEYDAMVVAAKAATTTAERQRLVIEIDRWLVEYHAHIWGSRVPQMNVVQPWVIGFNGECELNDMDRLLIAARLWIDSGLKEASGH